MKKNLPTNAGYAVFIPGSGKSPGEGNDNPLQYSPPGKSHGQKEPGRLQFMGPQKSWTWPSDLNNSNNNIHSIRYPILLPIGLCEEWTTQDLWVGCYVYHHNISCQDHWSCAAVDVSAFWFPCGAAKLLSESSFNLLLRGRWLGCQHSGRQDREREWTAFEM